MFSASLKITFPSFLDVKNYLLIIFRFFNILAECQRKSVAEKCGANLGDLHADFLLSFVPDTCSSKNSHKPKEIAPPHKPMASTPSPDRTHRHHNRNDPGLKDEIKTLPPDILDVESNKMRARSLKNETTSGSDVAMLVSSLSLIVVVNIVVSIRTAM